MQIKIALCDDDVNALPIQDLLVHLQDMLVMMKVESLLKQ